MPKTTDKATFMAWRRLLHRLSWRRCCGCDDPSFHDAHLTWIGRRRYTK
jgi:hypothetical protein